MKDGRKRKEGRIECRKNENKVDEMLIKGWNANRKARV